MPACCRALPLGFLEAVERAPRLPKGPVFLLCKPRTVPYRFLVLRDLCTGREWSVAKAQVAAVVRDLTSRGYPLYIVLPGVRGYWGILGFYPPRYRLGRPVLNPEALLELAYCPRPEWPTTRYMHEAAQRLCPRIYTSTH